EAGKQKRRSSCGVLQPGGDCSPEFQRHLTSRAVGRLTRWIGTCRLQCRAAKDIGLRLSQLQRSSLRRLPRVLRILVCADRLPYFQIDFYASYSRSIGGARGSMLAYIYLAA